MMTTAPLGQIIITTMATLTIPLSLIIFRMATLMMKMSYGSPQLQNQEETEPGTSEYNYDRKKPPSPLANDTLAPAQHATENTTSNMIALSCLNAITVGL
jgi:hypothetical protein